MTLMYNTLYNCIKMHVFYVNNINLDQIFHYKIFTNLFNIFFHFFFINGIEFSSLSTRKKVKLIYI